jgi:thioredoxin 1
MSNLEELSDEEFDATLNETDVPVLIDFSATWCQPCKNLAPTLEAVAKEYDAKLKVYKVDVDKSPAAAMSHGILGLPTCVFFKTGKEVDRFTGNPDLRSVKDRVDKVLAS